jgi:cytoplasmic iron level regulating protein YaaA (DUF328/UPF0246 family)
MLIVISPAKTLDYESELPPLRATQPRLLDHSAELVARARALSPADLSSLMTVSDRIAHLNAERFAQWSRPFDKHNARPALFAFKGDVYTGLDVSRFSAEDLKKAQRRLRILSGLYGVLRPLDLMQPYRLEMGIRLENPRGKNLYQFWGDTITRQLHKDMETAGTGVLVNLASNEYFRSVRRDDLPEAVIEPVFQDEKNGTYKVISFYAKKARGLMAAWMIQAGIETPADLKHFREGGYRFDPRTSSETRPVFRRAAA